MRKCITFFALVVFGANITLAADVRALKNLFQRSFYTDMYTPNYCGRNIESFVREAMRDGINLDNAHIVQITNAGFDMFGMVAALSAREQGRLIVPTPTKPPFREISNTNWNFHVVLIADGEVFDFDYMNKATVVKLPRYLDGQFIPVKYRRDLKYIKNKIGPYKFALHPAEKYMDYLDRRISMKEIRTELYLREYLPSYFNIVGKIRIFKDIFL